MGGHPYWYFVPFQADTQKALDELRAREFAAGRYHPVISFLKFNEPAFSAQRPGAEHASIDEAIAAADGTRSILDIARVGHRADYGVATPISPGELTSICGSKTPSHEDIESALSELLEGIERGQCRYVIVYDGGVPNEIWFGGYSYD